MLGSSSAFMLHVSDNETGVHANTAIDQETHNPFVPGLSPGGPTIYFSHQAQQPLNAAPLSPAAENLNLPHLRAPHPQAAGSLAAPCHHPLPQAYP